MPQLLARDYALQKSPVLLLSLYYTLPFFVLSAPQWRAVDAEIKVPSDENTELKRSPFTAWSRSV